MMPVNERVIEAHAQPFRTECVHILLNEILSAGRIGGLIIRILAVKETEAFVMLGGHDHIFHAGRFCLSCPIPGIIQIRIEIFEIKIVMLLGNFFIGLYPFVARRHGVKPEMDKHAEPVMGEPAGVSGSFACYIACHDSSVPP